MPERNVVLTLGKADGQTLSGLAGKRYPREALAQHRGSRGFRAPLQVSNSILHESWGGGENDLAGRIYLKLPESGIFLRGRGR